MNPPWWRGSRGEWYVVAQVLLLALVLFGPRRSRLVPLPAMPLLVTRRYAGALLMLAGVAMAVAAVIRLRRSLSPLPAPKADGQLAQAGVYGLVRHPIYGGLVLAALGWALLTGSWLTLGYALALWLLLEAKAGREERWLLQKYSAAYADYRCRVRRKLIPFLR